jgi:DNA-binding NtrC family response regulator
MKFHNIPFYIASESITKSEELSKILNHESNTVFTVIDIPEIYAYLNKCKNFTCFILKLGRNKGSIDNIIKAINQKNPNFPIILISDFDITAQDLRHFISIGASDVLEIHKLIPKNELLDNLLNILNLKWRSYLHTKKENEKIFKASVVTINHEINQPLTVILNAIGLLKAELKQEAEKEAKVNSHLNFIAKSIQKIQSLLDDLKNVKKIALKEYSSGVWMVNIDKDPTQHYTLNRTKINNKNTVLVVEKNLEDRKIIENQLNKMGLEIINAINLQEAVKTTDKLIHKIQAVLFSANIPNEELEKSMYEFNNRNEIVPLIIIKNSETTTENLKLLDSTAFQIVNNPISPKALQDAIANSVIVAN